MLLAIDGRSGAGKSTLATALLDALLADGVDAELFRLEDLYPGWDGLRAGIDAYVLDVLTPLTEGRTAEWSPWDWASDAPASLTRSTRPAGVVLCEGVGAGAAPARALLDATLTLRAAATDRKRRALARDGETYRPHWERWAAQEEALPAVPDAAGDLTLDARDPADPALFAAALAWARSAVARAGVTAARR